ncbi:MAG: hypothetical protein IIB88_10770, partial [Chloroflexi bacterium]|nr:hypothetical protein [Chloroflexota bacterium]
MNVSDFGFDADKGTFLVKGSFPFASAAARAILTIDDGGTTDRFYFELDASENVNFSTTHSADTDGASDGSAVIAADTQFKIVAAYADDNVRAAVDGTLSPADSTAALPLADTMTTVRFGA